MIPLYDTSRHDFDDLAPDHRKRTRTANSMLMFGLRGRACKLVGTGHEAVHVSCPARAAWLRIETPHEISR
jgi:hypothetical protein